MIERMPRNTPRGFTLVEFAIANLVAMALLAATFTVMGAIFKSNDRIGDMMITQQNVRVAMNTIARDVTMAGTGLPSSGVAVPNGANSTPIIRPGMADFGSPDREIATPNGVLPIVSPADSSGPTVSGTDTDALTIFTVDQDSPTWTVSAIGAFTGRYEVSFTQNIATGSMQLSPGDLLLFHNANGDVLGCVSDISPDTNTLGFFRAGDAMGVNQPAAATGNIGSILSSPLALTTAVRVSIINYYVSTASVSHPRLMRAVNAQVPQLLADEIENIQFSFDLFDFSTSTENSNVPTTDTPSQVRAVNVSINGRSKDKVAATNDYFRFALVSKVSVRNATFRNRYQG